MIAKYKKKKRPGSRSLIFPVLLGALILLLIGFLANANLKLGGKKTELKTEAEILGSELQTLKEQKELLETQISWSAEGDYLEQIARDIRNLMKEGEKTVVVVPPPDEAKAQEEEKAKSFLENILDWIR